MWNPARRGRETGPGGAVAEKQDDTCGRDYRTAYPGRLFHPRRLERLREQGIPFCPACGAELPAAAEGTGFPRCLRCGAPVGRDAGGVGGAGRSL